MDFLKRYCQVNINNMKSKLFKPLFSKISFHKLKENKYHKVINLKNYFLDLLNQR